MQGKIIKGIAGFYYVHVPNEGIYECKARESFEKKIGNRLWAMMWIWRLRMSKMPRKYHTDSAEKNALIRPAVANIDQALLIFAMTKPEPNYNLLDRFLIMMRRQGLECILCFNKQDLSDAGQQECIQKIYKDSGCSILFVSAEKRRH